MMFSALEQRLGLVLKALGAEQTALLARDADALEQAVRTKQDALSQLWVWMGSAGEDAVAAARQAAGPTLRQAMSMNETNGRLMAERGAEVSQALQTLRSALPPTAEVGRPQSLYRPSGVVDFLR